MGYTRTTLCPHQNPGSLASLPRKPLPERPSAHALGPPCRRPSFPSGGSVQTWPRPPLPTWPPHLRPLHHQGKTVPGLWTLSPALGVLGEWRCRARHGQISSLRLAVSWNMSLKFSFTFCLCRLLIMCCVLRTVLPAGLKISFKENPPPRPEALMLSARLFPLLQRKGQ